MLGAGWDKGGVDVVTVVLMEYKEVLVSVAGGDRECSCLICVDLSCYGNTCRVDIF